MLVLMPFTFVNLSSGTIEGIKAPTAGVWTPDPKNLITETRKINTNESFPKKHNCK